MDNKTPSRLTKQAIKVMLQQLTLDEYKELVQEEIMPKYLDNIDNTRYLLKHIGYRVYKI